MKKTLLYSTQSFLVCPDNCHCSQLKVEKQRRPGIKGFNGPCLAVVQMHPLEKAQLHSHIQIQRRQTNAFQLNANEQNKFWYKITSLLQLPKLGGNFPCLRSRWVILVSLYQTVILILESWRIRFSDLHIVITQ